MKVLTLFIFMTFPCMAFSQVQDSIFQYCQVKIVGKTLSRKVSIEVDYGQEQKVFDKSAMVHDEQGNIRTFNSIAHALNYMGTLGWRVVQVLSTGSDPSISNYYYLMETRKKLSN